MPKLIRENHFKVSSDDSLIHFLLSQVVFLHEEEEIIDLLKNKLLLLNDSCVQQDVPVKAGDTITLLTPQSLEPPVNTDINIIFEDDALLVLDKPAPLPMHPAGKYWFNTLTWLLQRLYPQIKLFSVNRLDSETSGVVIFTKSSEYANNLRKQFLAKTVEKKYVAIVFGTPKPSQGLIEQPLVEATYGAIRNKMLPSDVGHVAKTKYELVSSSSDSAFSLLNLVPFTGKKHQLRVHLASIGHPIVGDKVYGAHPNLFTPYVANPVTIAPEILEKLLSLRHFLHCERLACIHPKTGKSVFFKAKIGEDMLRFLDKYGF